MLLSEDYLKRGHLALDWASTLVDRQTGFDGAGNLINGYYKSIVAMTTGARIREARLLAKFIDRTFFRGGDINTLPDDPTAQGLANYRTAWCRPWQASPPVKGSIASAALDPPSWPCLPWAGSRRRGAVGPSSKG